MRSKDNKKLVKTSSTTSFEENELFNAAIENHAVNHTDTTLITNSGEETEYDVHKHLGPSGLAHKSHAPNQHHHGMNHGLGSYNSKLTSPKTYLNVPEHNRLLHHREHNRPITPYSHNHTYGHSHGAQPHSHGHSHNHTHTHISHHQRDHASRDRFHIQNYTSKHEPAKAIRHFNPQHKIYKPSKQYKPNLHEINIGISDLDHIIEPSSPETDLVSSSCVEPNFSSHTRAKKLEAQKIPEMNLNTNSSGPSSKYLPINNSVSNHREINMRSRSRNNHSRIIEEPSDTESLSSISQVEILDTSLNKKRSMDKIHMIRTRSPSPARERGNYRKERKRYPSYKGPENFENLNPQFRDKDQNIKSHSLSLHHVQVTEPTRHGVQIADNFAQKQQSFLQKIGHHPIFIGCLFFSANFIFLFLNKWILMKYCNYPMITLSLLGQVLIVIVWKELTYKPPKLNYVEPEKVSDNLPVTCNKFTLGTDTTSNNLSNFYSVSVADKPGNFKENNSNNITCNSADKSLRNSTRPIRKTKRKTDRKSSKHCPKHRDRALTNHSQANSISCSQKVERNPKMSRYNNNNSKKYSKAGSTYEFTKQDIKILLPVAFFQILSLTLMLYALKKLNIAVLDTLKRMVPLFHLIFFYLLLSKTYKKKDLEQNKPSHKKKRKYTNFQIFTILIICIGTAVSLSFVTNIQPQDVIFALSSLAFKSLYQTLVEKYGKNKYTVAIMVYKVTILSLLPMGFTCWLIEGKEAAIFAADVANISKSAYNGWFIDSSDVRDEAVGPIKEFQNFTLVEEKFCLANPNLTKTDPCCTDKSQITPVCNTLYSSENAIPAFILDFLILAVGGYIIKQISFSAMKILGALPCSMISLVKSTLTTMIGLTYFGDVCTNAGLLVGLCLNLLGGVMFSVSKIRNNMRRKKEKKKRKMEKKLQEAQENLLESQPKLEIQAKEEIRNSSGTEMEEDGTDPEFSDSADEKTGNEKSTLVFSPHARSRISSTSSSSSSDDVTCCSYDEEALVPDVNYENPANSTSILSKSKCKIQETLGTCNTKPDSQHVVMSKILLNDGNQLATSDFIVDTEFDSTLDSNMGKILQQQVSLSKYRPSLGKY